MENATGFKIRLFNVSASNLMTSRVFNRIDTYFVFKWPTLDPFQTPISYRDVNPKWDNYEQTLFYQPNLASISKEFLKNQFFLIQLYTKHKLKKDSVIGNLSLDLFTILNGPKEFRLNLKNEKDITVGRIKFFIDVVYSTKTIVAIEDISCNFFDKSSKLNLFISTSMTSNYLKEKMETSIQYLSSNPYWKDPAQFSKMGDLRSLIEDSILIQIFSTEDDKNLLVTEIELPMKQYIHTKENQLYYFTQPLYATSNLSQEQIGTIEGYINFAHLPLPCQMETGYYQDGVIYDATPILFDYQLFSGLNFTDMNDPLYQPAESVEKKVLLLPEVFVSQIRTQLEEVKSIYQIQNEENILELLKKLQNIYQFIKGNPTKKRTFFVASGTNCIRDILRYFLEKFSDLSQSHYQTSVIELSLQILYCVFEGEIKYQEILRENDCSDLKLLVKFMNVLPNPLCICQIVHLYAIRDSKSQETLRGLGVIHQLFILAENLLRNGEKNELAEWCLKAVSGLIFQAKSSDAFIEIFTNETIQLVLLSYLRSTSRKLSDLSLSILLQVTKTNYPLQKIFNQLFPPQSPISKLDDFSCYNQNYFEFIYYIITTPKDTELSEIFLNGNQGEQIVFILSNFIYYYSTRLDHPSFIERKNKIEDLFYSILSVPQNRISFVPLLSFANFISLHKEIIPEPFTPSSILFIFSLENILNLLQYRSNTFEICFPYFVKDSNLLLQILSSSFNSENGDNSNFLLLLNQIFHLLIQNISSTQQFEEIITILSSIQTISQDNIQILLLVFGQFHFLLSSKIDLLVELKELSPPLKNLINCLIEYAFNAENEENNQIQNENFIYIQIHSKAINCINFIISSSTPLIETLISVLERSLASNNQSVRVQAFHFLFSMCKNKQTSKCLLYIYHKLLEFLLTLFIRSEDWPSLSIYFLKIFELLLQYDSMFIPQFIYPFLYSFLSILSPTFDISLYREEENVTGEIRDLVEIIKKGEELTANQHSNLQKLLFDALKLIGTSTIDSKNFIFPPNFSSFLLNYFFEQNQDKCESIDHIIPIFSPLLNTFPNFQNQTLPLFLSILQSSPYSHQHSIIKMLANLLTSNQLSLLSTYLPQLITTFHTLLQSNSQNVIKIREENEEDDEEEEREKIRKEILELLKFTLQNVRYWPQVLPQLQENIENCFQSKDSQTLHYYIDTFYQSLLNLYPNIEGTNDIPQLFFENFNIIQLYIIAQKADEHVDNSHNNTPPYSPKQEEKSIVECSMKVEEKCKHLLLYLVMKTSTIHFNSSLSIPVLLSPVHEELNEMDLKLSLARSNQSLSSLIPHFPFLQLTLEILSKITGSYTEYFISHIPFIASLAIVTSTSSSLSVTKSALNALTNLIKIPVALICKLSQSAIPLQDLLQMVQKGELEIIKSVWRIIRGLFFDPKKQTEFQELGGFFLLGKCISYLDNQISDLSITTLEEVLQFLVGASKLQHLQEIIMEDGLIPTILGLLVKYKREGILLPSLGFIYFISNNSSSREEIIDSADVDLIPVIMDDKVKYEKISKAAEECYVKLGGFLDKCTIAESKEIYSQQYYSCITCGLNSPGICANCAKICHRGHTLSAVMKGDMRCECGSSYFCLIKERANLRARVPLHLCSILFTGRAGTFQEGFVCLTCFPDGHRMVCKTCSQTCHVGHQIVFTISAKFCCGCGERLGSVCLCRKPPLYKPNTLPRRRKVRIQYKPENLAVLKNDDCPVSLFEVKKEIFVGPEEDDDTCIVCMDSPKTAMFYKCGHIAACMDCACTLKQRGEVCVICRKPIVEVVQIFSSG